MVDWRSLITEAALASALPGAYGRFVRPVRDGLIVFLEGLPESHQQEIIDEQAALPLSASISERLAAIARACPVLHKLGQILARDQQLAPELRQQLGTLESLAPTVPLAEIERVLRQELGATGFSAIRLVPPAIAEASVAVVIPYAHAHVEYGAADGVLKVLKPGIEERLQLELDVLGRVGFHLDERCDDLRIPHLDYEDVFQQIQSKLAREVLLDEEQRHLARAYEFYADEPRVHIPALREPCTPRVTAMERIHGVKLLHQYEQAADEPLDMSELIVRSLIARPIFSRAPWAMFHSDPHAGNLMVTDERRLAMLDWSLVGELGERERTVIVQMLLAAATLNADRLRRLLTELSDSRSLDGVALEDVVQSGLAKIRGGQIPGLTWLTALLDDAVQRCRLRVPPDLLMFRKSLHTLFGLLAELGAGAETMDNVLLREFLRYFAEDWPRRWVTAPDSLEFATRLSSFDLAEACMNLPYAWARFWLGRGMDLLGPGRVAASA